MTTSPTATSGEQTLHCALELSKNSWLLAVQFPGRDNPSLHPIRGGDTSGLMTNTNERKNGLLHFCDRRQGQSRGAAYAASCR